MICKNKEAKLKAICTMLFLGANVKPACFSDWKCPSYCLNSGNCNEGNALQKKMKISFTKIQLKSGIFARPGQEAYVKIRKKVFLKERLAQIQKENWLTSEDLIHIKRINSCSFLVYYITFAETHLYFNLTEICQLEMCCSSKSALPI